MYILGSFRMSWISNEKVVVITDYMTRWAIVVPVFKENPEQIADVLVKEVVLKLGTPQAILSDRGKSLKTALMKQCSSRSTSGEVVLI